MFPLRYPLVVQGPKFGDLLFFRSSQESGQTTFRACCVLKGSWNLVARAINKAKYGNYTGNSLALTPVKVLITVLTKSHEPLSTVQL